jgi:hypothetical protein
MSALSERFARDNWTCEPNCGCECDYDVKACRQFTRDRAHVAAHVKTGPRRL